MANQLMHPTGPAHAGRAPRWLLRTIVAVGVLVALSGCGGDSTPVPADVAAQFDVPDQSVVVLGESAAEPVATLDLRSVADRASEAGIDLRIVVAGDDQDLVDATAVVDSYGGTALSYQAGEDTFQAASNELTVAQLNRAAQAAGTPRDMAASAAAFVDVIESEGPDLRGWSTRRVILWVAFVLAGLFFLSQLVALIRSRRRAATRRAEFDERLDGLRDWAARIEQDAEAAALHADRLDAEGARLLGETRTQIGAARTALASATTLAELDANEIRVARAAMKLRTVRRQTG